MLLVVLDGGGGVPALLVTAFVDRFPLHEGELDYPPFGDDGGGGAWGDPPPPQRARGGRVVASNKDAKKGVSIPRRQNQYPPEWYKMRLKQVQMDIQKAHRKTQMDYSYLKKYDLEVCHIYGSDNRLHLPSKILNIRIYLTCYLFNEINGIIILF